jgi:replicative DNA helicase
MLVQMARGLAEAGHGVLLITLEDTTRQIAIRTLASAAGLDADRVGRGDIRDYEWASVAHGAGQLASLPFHIDDRARPRVEDVVARIYATHSRHPNIDVAIIDYVQKLHAAGRWSGKRNDELEVISGQLAATAHHLRIAVGMGAQLNREYEKRGGGRPMGTDLRDSGAIEQDSRLTIQLERPQLFGVNTLGEPNHEPSDGKAVAWVVKNTHGKSGGRVVLDFDAATLTFSDPSAEWRPRPGAQNREHYTETGEL